MGDNVFWGYSIYLLLHNLPLFTTECVAVDSENKDFFPLTVARTVIIYIYTFSS